MDCKHMVREADRIEDCLDPDYLADDPETHQAVMAKINQNGEHSNSHSSSNGVSSTEDTAAVAEDQKFYASLRVTRRFVQGPNIRTEGVTVEGKITHKKDHHNIPDVENEIPRPPTFRPRPVPMISDFGEGSFVGGAHLFTRPDNRDGLALFRASVVDDAAHSLIEAAVNSPDHIDLVRTLGAFMPKEPVKP